MGYPAPEPSPHHIQVAQEGHGQTLTESEGKTLKKPSQCNPIHPSTHGWPGKSLSLMKNSGKRYQKSDI